MGQPHIKTIIQGSQILTLIDTGSQICCIDKSFIEKNNLWDHVKITKDVAIVGIGNNPLLNFGCISLAISFVESNNLVLTESFYVIENLGVPAILSFEFLTKHNAILNTKTPPCLELDNSNCKIPIIYLNDDVKKPRERDEIVNYKVSGIFRVSNVTKHNYVDNYNYKPIPGCDLRKIPPRIVHNYMTARPNNSGPLNDLVVNRKGPLNNDIAHGQEALNGPPLNTRTQYFYNEQCDDFKKGLNGPDLIQTPYVTSQLYNRSRDENYATSSFIKVNENTEKVNTGPPTSLKEKISYFEKNVSKPKVSEEKGRLTSKTVSQESNEMKDYGNKYSELYTATKLKIPGRSESTKLIEISSELCQKFKEKTVFVEPLYNLLDKGIVMARSVSVIKNKVMPIRLINLSKNDVTVPSKTLLATVVECKLDTMPEHHTVISDGQMKCNVIRETKITKNEDEKWYEQMTLGKLTQDQHEESIQFVEEFESIFSKDELDIGECKLLPAKIELKSETPIFTRQYPLAPKNLDKIKEEVIKMEQMNVIQKSTSGFNSPVIAVPKPNGEVRVCLDYRKINEATVEMNTPIPSFEEASRLLAGNTFFSSLDLQRGFNQMVLHPDSYKYTAFSVQQNRYEYVRLPFGSKNSTFYFQQLMSLVLGDMQYTELLVYIDDILVFSKTFEEHLIKLRKIFTKLKEANLKLKTSKCHLLDKKIKFLGHIISAEGIYPDPKKSEAVRNFGTPTDKKSVRSFLGLTNFFRRFIENYSVIAYPLTELTSDKNKFEWTEKEDLAFNKLKRCLISPQILRHPQSDKPYKLLVDASKKGCGAILIQTDDEGRDFAIAYHSRKLKDAETRYPSYDLELLSLVEAVEHFKTYLLSAPFTIFVDCCPLKHLMTQKDPTQKHWRWINRLSEFNFTIVHKKASDHVAVDCLSRDPRFEREIKRVNNNTIDLLEKIEVNKNDLNKWKENIITELSLVKNKDMNLQTEISTRNDDSLYQIMSQLFTENTANSAIFRNCVVKFVQTHKKYLEMSSNLPNEKLSKYIRDIKLGKKAENMELECVSSMFFVPIVLIKKGEKIIFLPTMKSHIKTMPPHGVTIHLSVTEQGDYKWDNPDLNFHAEDDDTDVIQHQKSERIVYPCEQTTDTEIETKAKEVCRVCVLNKIDEEDFNVHVPTIAELKACQNQDPYCQEWISYINTGDFPRIDRKEFQNKRECMKISEDGILVYTPAKQERQGEENHPKIVLPLTLWKFVLVSSHDKMAHIGRDKTEHLIRLHYYRPNIHGTVAKYIKSCVKCKNKIGQKNRKLYPIQRMPMVQERFCVWHLDHFGPLPKNKNNNRYILVCVDSYTRWPEMFAVPDQTAETVVMTLMNLIARFGMMTDIITDRGSAFHGNVLKGLYDHLGIKRHMTTPYHAASNGCVERINQTIVNGLKTLIQPTQEDWEEQIPFVLMAYRATIHKFSNDSPYFCVYGKNMNLPTQILTETEQTGRYAVGIRPEALGTEIALRLNHARREYLKIMEKQASKTQKYANRNREPIEFKVGQSVMLHRVLTKKKLSQKLHSVWVPGFVITKQNSETNFTVKHLWKRREFRVNAENIRAYDVSFRINLDEWYQEAEEIMEGLKDKEVTPPIYAETPYVEAPNPDGDNPSDLSPVQNKKITGKRKTELELLVNEPYYVIGGKKILEKDLMLPPARSLRPRPQISETAV